MKAQNKYLENKREIQREIDRKEALKENCRSNQRLRKHSFIRMSSDCLIYLTQGRTPTPNLMHFQLVLENEVFYKEELLMTKEESNAWLNGFGTAFLEAAMSVQILVLIPKSKWLGAVQSVELNQENEKLRNKLFRLIGKLQAGENPNTKGIIIDQRYHSEKKIRSEKWCYKNAIYNDVITTEDEKILVEFVADILGEKEGLLNRELQELLGITKDTENLCNALTYTSNKSY